MGNRGLEYGAGGAGKFWVGIGGLDPGGKIDRGGC